MLFLDIDGTLIGKTNELRPALKNALLKARDAGIRMAICTGRTGKGLSADIANVLAPDGPHIFESGGAIIKMDGTVIATNPMSRETAVAIAEAAMEIAPDHDASAEFYTPEGIFVSKKSDFSLRHAAALKIDEKEILLTDVREIAKNHDVIRIQWVASEEAMKVALERTPSEATVAVATTHVIPHCLFASVTHTGIDKGTAVRYVAEKIWHVDLADCYAAGDSVGDVPMLNVVGHPFIMGSATPDLLAAYPSVPDVEQDGVIEILNQLV